MSNNTRINSISNCHAQLSDIHELTKANYTKRRKKAKNNTSNKVAITIYVKSKCQSTKSHGSNGVRMHEPQMSNITQCLWREQMFV